MNDVKRLSSLALSHHQAGRLEEAERIYQQVLQISPDRPDTLHLLGLISLQHNRYDYAIEMFKRAVVQQANNPDYHTNLGRALMASHLPSEAAASFRRSLDLNPCNSSVHRALGLAFKAQGKHDEAIACFRSAVDMNPADADAYFWLGNLLKLKGMPSEAIACYHRVLELNPDDARAYNNLANALNDLGKQDEAVAYYRQAIGLNPDYAKAHSNMLCAMQYCPDVTPASLAEAHKEYHHRHAAPLASAQAQHESNSIIPKLRLGFVSPDFGRHPVGYFLVRILENLDPEICEIFCYSDRIVYDDMTQRLQASSSLWRNVISLSDEQLASQIRDDRIDILFDLAGHTANNRLLVFARKPAPIQITWAGYVGTTGLTAMDYILADRFQIPTDAEAYYCEKVLRMPDGYICYDPPSYAPPVSSLPALNRGYVTFGCFNNLAKYNRNLIRTWATILQRLPNARLVLKTRGLTLPSVVQDLVETFASHGIDQNRLELLDHSPHTIALAEYNLIDIALDPFPYSGGLTTCEALWMGVPVITYPGETFAGRHSFSHLSNVGLTETIALDHQAYTGLAVTLAQDWQRLSRIRGCLRERVAVSALCDGKRFATNLLSILQNVRASAAH